MKRLLAIGGLLAGLSGCVASESALEDAISEGTTEETSSPSETFELSGAYFLRLDDERLSGLRDFYWDSLDYRINEGDVLDNLVVVNVEGINGGRGHGYLINDNGLVLTASHVVENLNKHGLVNGNIITRDGEVYSIRRTGLNNHFLDFAVVSAETGKESKTHPLKFIDTIFAPYDLDASFNVADFSVPGDLVYNSFSGKVLHVVDMIRGREDMKWSDQQGALMGMLLRKGSIFLDTDVEHGYSGSPVFSGIDSNSPTFLGLVRSGLGKGGYVGDNPRIPSHEFMDGFTAITTSRRILEGIGDYLRENGALNASID